MPRSTADSINTTSPRDFRAGGFRTIADALDYAAGSRSGVAFYSGDGSRGISLTYRELRERALDAAAGLIAAGLRPFDRLALIATSDIQFLSVFYACQYASIVPCPLPYRTFAGAMTAYCEQIHRLVDASRARALIVPAALDRILDRPGAELLTYEELSTGSDSGALRPFRADEPAYVQYSSGSTADPKGVLVSQNMVASNVSGILTQGLRLRPDDRAFSWLPLYHDMGLVGFSIAPLFGQCSVDYLAPSTFARRPTLWLKLMSELGSTICYAPSFGYELAARRYRSEPVALDLTRLRVCGIGGDMIRPDALEEFADAMAPTGFSRNAFLPSYGMAESTLAISISEPGSGYGIDTFDGRRFVVCGRPFPDHDIEIVDADGKPAPERTVGQIRIRGPSVMTLYADDGAGGGRSPEEFLDTGDLGYLAGGEVVVTGRCKDMILQNGRNIWPQDIEWAIERIAPSCRVAAFGVDTAAGIDRIVVLVQTSAREQDRRDQLLRDAQGTAVEAVGASCEVVLVPPNSLPFTSSGKLARGKARQLYLYGVFPRAL